MLVRWNFFHCLWERGWMFQNKTYLLAVFVMQSVAYKIMLWRCSSMLLEILKLVLFKQRNSTNLWLVVKVEFVDLEIADFQVPRNAKAFLRMRENRRSQLVECRASKTTYFASRLLTCHLSMTGGFWHSNNRYIYIQLCYLSDYSLGNPRLIIG